MRRQMFKGDAAGICVPRPKIAPDARFTFVFAGSAAAELAVLAVSPTRPFVGFRSSQSNSCTFGGSGGRA
jgi:hypothetical protein